MPCGDFCFCGLNAPACSSSPALLLELPTSSQTVTSDAVPRCGEAKPHFALQGLVVSSWNSSAWNLHSHIPRRLSSSGLQLRFQTEAQFTSE